MCAATWYFLLPVLVFADSATKLTKVEYSTLVHERATCTQEAPAARRFHQTSTRVGQTWRLPPAEAKRVLMVRVARTATREATAQSRAQAFLLFVVASLIFPAFFPSGPFSRHCFGRC